MSQNGIVSVYKVLKGREFSTNSIVYVFIDLSLVKLIGK